MWAQKRLREPRRVFSSTPAGVRLEELSGYVSFVPRETSTGDVLQWEDSPDGAPAELLRQAIVTGSVGGPWLGGCPKYAWHRSGDAVLEFRLTGRSPGEYTGYRLHPSEWPEGMT